MTISAAPGTSPSADQTPTPELPAVENLDFATLGLPRRLVDALARQGITTPFEIQRATLPDALAGHDVLGRGQTGSGKTLAFGLPVIARLAERNRARPLHPRALVLVPTRELAMQVNDALMPLGKAVGIFVKTAVGGVPYDRQIDSLRRGVEIVVATPGRLGDLIERGVCRLDDVEITVLDEADQMADMGFLPEVTELLAKTPADAQRLLFSATLDNDVDTLVSRFMTDPITHSTAPPTAAVSTMDHHLLLIPPHDKFAVAASIAARDGRTMLFARTQLGVDRLVEQLAAVGVRAGGLHGGKTQRMRTRTLAEFREGRMNVLVATDVAARGIHVDGVSLVLHVDPPKDPKDYLHRAGRTARAGESGAVATLVLPKQRRTTLAMLEKAGVEPAQARVRAGDPALSELTGAREPSGVPVRDEPEPRRHGDRPSGPRRFGSRERGSFDRGERGSFDRGGRGSFDRGERGSFERGERRERASFETAGRGSFDRGERGSFDRGGQGERRFGDRGDRVFVDRDERRSGQPSGERRERPGDRGGERRSSSARGYGDRDTRSYSERDTRSHGDRDTRGYGDRVERRYEDRPQDARRFGDRDSRGDRRFGDRSGDHRPTEHRTAFRPAARNRDDRRPSPDRHTSRTH
ncbi:DEAD/DEAH box helicase [Micromonospora sp. NPDC093277]|uniref:DEAD/DEAH box helicase n=1 Tax=Micromonospora sp. NPDC093277 TaxID=3364291 RepID=UPI00380BBFF7